MIAFAEGVRLRSGGQCNAPTCPSPADGLHGAMRGLRCSNRIDEQNPRRVETQPDEVALAFRVGFFTSYLGRCVHAVHAPRLLYTSESRVALMRRPRRFRWKSVLTKDATATSPRSASSRMGSATAARNARRANHVVTAGATAAATRNRRRSQGSIFTFLAADAMSNHRSVPIRSR
jgi:hypothetical protein